VVVHPRGGLVASAEDKPRIVRETSGAGAVAKAMADRRGISTGLLFTSREELRWRGPGG
jgi:transposase-like protein